MADIGREFMEKTKYRYAQPSDQMKGIKSPSAELSYNGSGDVLALPDPNENRPMDLSLVAAIENRRSCRSFAQKPVTQAELSWLLWATQKVMQAMPAGTLRNVPSAGARHAFETYLLVNRVADLRSGIYRYLASTHQLAETNMELGIGASVMNGCLGQHMVIRSGVTFIWTAVVERMRWRYGQRGYRYLFLDAGHVCQNLYLAAEAIGCGVCAIAAFDDDIMNRILDLDGEEQFVIYMAVLGKKSKDTTRR